MVGEIKKKMTGDPLVDPNPEWISDT